MRRAIATMPTLALALVLAGCDRAAPTPDEPNAAAPAASPGPTAQGAAAGRVPGAAVPAAYHGIWAGTAGECDRTSERRMVVLPDSIRFYESHGDVTAVRAEPGGIALDLTLSGEGETWHETSRFVLSDDGGRLTRTVSGRQTLTYSRCPA